MKTVDVLKEMKETTTDPVIEVSSFLETISEDERDLIKNAGFFNNRVSRPSSFKQVKGKVYHINEIRKICLKYDFKFLSPKEYRGEVHPLLGANLKAFRESRKSEDRYSCNYYTDKLVLLAPRELFEVKLDYDPILMYELDSQHFEVVDRWGRDITAARRFTAIARLFTISGTRQGFKKPFWPCFAISILWLAIGLAVTGLNCIWAKQLRQPFPLSGLALAIAFLVVWPICEFFGRKANFRKSNSELQNA